MKLSKEEEVRLLLIKPYSLRKNPDSLFNELKRVSGTGTEEFIRHLLCLKKMLLEK